MQCHLPPSVSAEELTQIVSVSASCLTVALYSGGGNFKERRDRVFLLYRGSSHSLSLIDAQATSAAILTMFGT